MSNVTEIFDSTDLAGSVIPTEGVVNERAAYLRALREAVIEADIEEVELYLSAKRLANRALRERNQAAMRHNTYEDNEESTNDRTTIKLEARDIDDDAISDGDTRTLYSTGASDNRGLIRQSLRELFANPLKSNELSATLAFARQIDRLAKFGGRECPLNFLSEARLRALRQYVNEKYGSDITLEQRYSDLRHSVGTFIKHLTEASITSRGLKEDKYLHHCQMPPSTFFSFTDIDNYLAIIRTDIESLPTMTEHSKVWQILEGLQPQSFCDRIKKNYPWMLAVGTVDGPEGIIPIIERECKIEQSTLDSMAAGYGTTGNNNNSDNNGGTGFNGGSGSGRHIRNLDCYNCGGAHHIRDCTESCKRCEPPCGKVSSECPVYLKHRGPAQALKFRERGEYMNRAYTSNNARVAKKLPQVPHRAGNTPAASDVESDSDNDNSVGSD